MHSQLTIDSNGQRTLVYFNRQVQDRLVQQMFHHLCIAEIVGKFFALAAHIELLRKLMPFESIARAHIATAPEIKQAHDT